jgi:hypothetical protein
MGLEELLKLDVAKLIILPVIGFFAGFAYKWFLQERKSRDELAHALATERAKKLHDLWSITSRPKIETLKDKDVVDPELLKEANEAILKWYREDAGALFLSWRATDLLFRVLDVLRRKGTVRKRDVRKAVSALRTRLKYDCGFYSYWDVERQLKDPKPMPDAWSSQDTRQRE